MPPTQSGITHALVDAVAQRDVDIEREGAQAALANRADDVISVRDGHATVGGGLHARRQPVGGDVTLGQLRDHGQIALVDVHEGEMRVAKFRHGQQVTHQTACEADRARANHRNL